MSWLDELERSFRYVCPAGHKTLYAMLSNTPEEVYRRPVQCLDCDAQAEYDGFERMQLGMTGRVLFDQNGRLAYRITRPDGKVVHISKTKYDYLESMGRTYEDEETSATGRVGYAKIKPAFTPAYEEHLRKIGRTDLLQETLIKDKRKPHGATISGKIEQEI